MCWAILIWKYIWLFAFFFVLCLLNLKLLENKIDKIDLCFMRMS